MSDEAPVNELQADKQTKKRKDKIPRQPKPAKQPKIEKDRLKEEMPAQVSFKVIDGVRYISPYWSAYTTVAKGRWYGQKLVDIFRREFVTHNPEYVMAAVRLGRLFVNNEMLRDPEYRIRNSDVIHHVVHRHEHPISAEPIRLIAETDNILAVNKPASLPIHACGQYKVHSVLGLMWLLHGRSGLRVLYRLDRTTSGVLVFAKNAETDRNWKMGVKKSEFAKHYVCKVKGRFPDGEQICEAPLGTLVVTLGIQCVRTDECKDAHSVFRRLWYDPVSDESLVMAHIITGRTHQIRVHLQFMGYPIADDTLYNRPEWGPAVGKNAEYGKSLEELGVAIRDAHRGDKWIYTMDPDYAGRLIQVGNDPNTKPENWSMKEPDFASGPEYDPYCMHCNVIKYIPNTSNFRISLHCWHYDSPMGAFTAHLPDWAWPPPSSATVDTDPNSIHSPPAEQHLPFHELTAGDVELERTGYVLDNDLDNRISSTGTDKFTRLQKARHPEYDPEAASTSSFGNWAAMTYKEHMVMKESEAADKVAAVGVHSDDNAVVGSAEMNTDIGGSFAAEATSYSTGYTDSQSSSFD